MTALSKLQLKQLWKAYFQPTSANFSDLIDSWADYNYTATGTSAVARPVISKLGDIVSVKDFGAVGDGVTDDTAAIQAAIDSFSPFNLFTTSGGHVSFPPGRYKITTSINLTGRHGVWLQGSGTHSTEVFMTSGTNEPVFESANTSSAPWVDGAITDMTIRGGGNALSDAHGITTTFTNGCLLRNLVLYSCRHALDLHHSWQFSLTTIDAHGGGADKSHIGLYMGPSTLANIDNAVTASDLTFKDCVSTGFRIINGQGSKFSQCEAGAMPIGWYIGAPPSGTVLCQWMHFTGCLSDSNSEYGWRIERGSATSLSEMQFSNCWAGYINSSGSTDYCNVFISDANDLIFSNCILINSPFHAMRILSSSRIQFSSSQILLFNQSNTSKQAISLFDSSRCNLSYTSNTANNFSGRDAIESGTSNLNNFDVLNSNGATLIGADSRYKGDATGASVSSGGSVNLSLIAKSGSFDSKVTLTNGGGNSWIVNNLLSNYLSFAYGASTWIYFDNSNGAIFPAGNGTQNLGAASNRWATLHTRDLVLSPAASNTPANNGNVTVELASNTSLVFKAKGSDGVVRSGTITLS